MDKLNPKAVSRLTGLPHDTLRAWERRYGAVVPQRTSTGRRYYSPHEVNRLKLLAQLVERGHAIGSIAKSADTQLVALLANEKAEALSGETGREASGQHVAQLLESLGAFDLESLRVQLALIRYRMSPRDFVFYLVPQLMMRVGARIEKGEFTVAQEHALSDLIKTHLRQFYEGLEPLEGTRKGAPSLLFATSEGDFHEFGVIMAAILCRSRGYRTQYLGANLPAASLADAARRVKPRAVVIGLSRLPDEHVKVSPDTYVRELDRNLPKRVELWAGGSASHLVRRTKLSRDVWVFESLEALETKLGAADGEGLPLTK